jgi:integrase
MRIMMRGGSGAREYRYIWEDTDRHGNVRVYFARSGQKKVRLYEKPGTDAFDVEYRKAFDGNLEAAALKSDSAAPVIPNSLRWFAHLYFNSSEFLDLDASTQKARRRDIEGVCTKRGHKPFAGMKARDVARIRDEKQATPEAANMVVKSLRQLFNWACKPEYQYADQNPTRDVPYLRAKNPDGFHTWTVDEIKQYHAKHPIGTKARLALDLMLYTGVRRSDVVQLGPQMVKDGWLRFTEVKGRRRKPKHRDVPLLPVLQQTIDASPSGHLNFL